MHLASFVQGAPTSHPYNPSSTLIPFVEPSYGFLRHITCVSPSVRKHQCDQEETIHMSLPPSGSVSIPEETARLARTICPKGTLYMRIRDQLGVIFENHLFAPLFSPRGQPAEAPWRLALVCIFQFLEGLTDRQAAEAVQQRIDWKYALALELSDPGFDFSVLCKFRARPAFWW
jgi:hypothetical protein